MEINTAAGLALAGLATILFLWFQLRRGLRRRQARRATAAGGPAQPLMERRIAALESAQREIVGRLDEIAAAGGPEERLQTMAGSLVGLIQDKNATLETALAGLDQLRGRLRTLERIGDLAEARALFDGLGSRIDALEAALKDTGSETRDRIETLQERLDGDGGPLAALGSRLAELHAQKETGLAAMVERLAPLEARLGHVEGVLEAPRDDAARVEARLEELGRVQAELRAGLAALAARAETGTAPLAELSEKLVALHDARGSAVETVLERLAPLEARLGAVEADLRDADPRPGLDRLAERLTASETRLGAEIATLRKAEAPRADFASLETKLAALDGAVAALRDAENPYAEIADQLTRLYAQKDAGLAAALERLAPLETRLGAVEAGLRDADARPELDRMADRLAAAEAAQAAGAARLAGEIAALRDAENPYAEIAERLTRLYAEKDAGRAETLERLAPLEARLGAVEAGLRDADARPELERLGGEIAALKAADASHAEIAERAARLAAETDAGRAEMQAAVAPLETKLAALDGAVAALRDAKNPYAEIADQLTRLYAQKDAGLAAALERLAPLETRLGAVEAGLRDVDPQAALDRLGAEIAALRAAQVEAETRLAGEIAAARDAENPFAEVSDQLTRLYAQKDAVAEAVHARLGPLEVKLAGLEAAVAAADPKPAMAQLEDRLAVAEAAQAADRERLGDGAAGLKAVEGSVAALADRLAETAAGGRAEVERLGARLAPLETRLGGLETGIAARDPAEALAGLDDRLERLRDRLAGLDARLAALDEDAAAPFAEIADQLTRLYAQKDAVAAGVHGRIAPLEARLAALEARSGPEDAETARAEAQAIATQLIAMRAAAEQTALFADRIALLEASLPRLTSTQSLMMAALERRATEGQGGAQAPSKVAAAPGEPAPDRVRPADEIDDIWGIPRVISMHKG